MSLKPKQQNIPTGWERKKLAETANFLDNKRVPIESDLRSIRQGIYPYYGASGIIDYIDNYIFDGEFVLLGEDGANILDRSSRLAFIAKGKIWVNNHAHVLEPKDSVLLYFLAEYLEKIDYRAYNTGSAQPKLNRAVCEKIPVILPPLPEQKRIVTVLETWDQAIEKLTRKIEIKKEVKRGLMQKLLTGEVRLTGFMSNWSIHNLGELGKIVSGGTPETSDSSYWGNDHIWITPTEITKLKSRYIFTSDKKISSLGLKNSSAALVPPQSLILCSRATIAECAINTVEVTTNQGFKNFIPKKIDISFLYYWVKLNKKAFYKISAGSTFLEFGKGDMEKLKISIPELKEQKAISEILIKADDEIDRLKSKLSIIKDQKRYLLNNLITGTIRTPESLSIPN